MLRSPAPVIRTNAAGILFSVLWRLGQDYLNNQK